MLQTFSKTTKTLGFFIGVIAISLSLSYLVLAWTEPSANPPNPNVSTPLNIGPTGQSKSGGLILNTGGAPNGLIVQNGNVGIGTASPGAKLEINGTSGGTLKIVDTNQGVGKVLTSDASGLASWEEAASGSVTTRTQPARVKGAVYQNTGTTPLYVLVSVSFNPPQGGIYVRVGTTSPPGINIAEITMNSNYVSVQYPVTFIVLPGEYYGFFGEWGNVVLSFWTEWR